MIAHSTLAVADCERAKAFYLKVLAPLGYRKNMDFGEAAGFNDGKNTDFWIAQHDTVAPSHLAFEAKTRQEVEAFYEAALAAGGKDNGEPGYRPDYGPDTTPPSYTISTATTSKPSGTTTRRRIDPVLA